VTSVVSEKKCECGSVGREHNLFFPSVLVQCLLSLSLFVSGLRYKEEKEEKSMNAMGNAKEKKQRKLESTCHYSIMTNKLTLSRRCFY